MCPLSWWFILWHQYCDGKSWWYLNLQGTLRATVIALKSQNFWHPILPFPCRFPHNCVEAKYFFWRTVAPLCEKIILLHLKEATLHLQWENLWWMCQFLVAFEIKTIKVEAKRVSRPCEPFGLYQVKISESELNIRSQRPIVCWIMINYCQRTMVIWYFLTELLQLQVLKKCWHTET